MLNQDGIDQADLFALSTFGGFVRGGQGLELAKQNTIAVLKANND